MFARAATTVSGKPDAVATSCVESPAARSCFAVSTGLAAVAGAAGVAARSTSRAADIPVGPAVSVYSNTRGAFALPMPDTCVAVNRCPTYGSPTPAALHAATRAFFCPDHRLMEIMRVPSSSCCDWSR